MIRNESIKILSDSKHVKRTLFSIVMVLIFFYSQIIFSPQVTAPSLSPLEKDDYIIITNHTFYDEMKIFAEWKEQMGLEVRIINDTEIYQDEEYSELSNDEAIHEYLNDSYHSENNQQEYVLLVGDHHKIPKYMNKSHSPARMEEHYFSYAWEENKNVIPDWKLGRWSVSTIEELRVIRDKTIDFQQNPLRGSWKNNITLIACNVGNEYKVKEKIKDYYIEESSDELNIIEIYAELDGTIKEVNETLNNGSIIVNYKGEGDPDKWRFNSVIGEEAEFNVSDVYYLHNNKKLSFVFSMSCHTGRIYLPLVDCFGEAWLNNSNGGAVAFIGNAEFGTSLSDASFDDEIFRLIYKDDVREIGEVFTKAQTKMMQDNPNQIYLWASYLLLGDPHAFIYHPDLVFDVYLSTGLNLISLPLDVTDPDVAPFDAQDLIDLINADGGDAVSVSRWLAVTGVWDTFNAGGASPFEIEPWEGYFISCNQASTWTATGRLQESEPVDLVAGLTLIGISKDMGLDYDAQDLIDDINDDDGSAQAISRWLAATGVWDTFNDGGASPFIIERGAGYFVNNAVASTWTP